MKNKERVQIFIDGGNFHHLVLKKLNIKELDFLFEAFAQFLSNSRTITNLGKRYYVGTVREQENNPKSKHSMAQQLKLFSKLWANNWQTKTSKLRLRKEKVIIDERTTNYQEILKRGITQIECQRFREKGIDVKIATDLLIGAAILVSSDTDLVPVIDLVRLRFKKKVEYIGFSIIDESPAHENAQPSPTMIKKTDIQRILVKSDLEKFIKKL